MAEIKVTHEDIEIGYIERYNTWRFVVDGREEEAESLLAARQRIDKVLKEIEVKSRKKFDAIPAFNSTTRGRITSLAARNRYSSGDDVEVWFVQDEKSGFEDAGARSKMSLTRLAPITEKNEELVARVKQYRQAIRDAEVQITYFNANSLDYVAKAGVE